MILFGNETRTVTGKLRHVAERCVALKQEGFMVDTQTSFINWPRFWERIYTVKLIKPVVCEITIAETCDTKTITDLL